MLLQRILTALVLAPLIVVAIFYKPDPHLVLFSFVSPFSIVMAMIVLIGAWEWTNLISMDKLWAKLLFLVMMIVPMVGITLWTQFLELMATVLEWQELKEYSGVIDWVVFAPVLLWVLIMILIRKVPEQCLQMDLKIYYKALTGWFVLLAAWMFISRLHALYGAEMVMYFLLLIWAADIAAYFTGKKFGKNKLSPVISPGKTVEGMYGALGSAVITAICLGLYYKFPVLNASDFVLLSVLTVLISIYGDLFFSLVKRQKGVKDSGSILPGHGGILDRIDSVIAAAPFFYAGIFLISRGIFA
jgi:phosphatidate cytidylyltransferase